MDLGQIGSTIASNWEVVTGAAVTLTGAYVYKIKRAVSSVIATVDDLKETRAIIIAALADRVVTGAEAEAIAKELGEDLVKIQTMTAHVLSVIPERFRKKLPVDVVADSRG